MWLLNTARAELKFFPTPESVPGGYAILSHAWDEYEQTFQDLQALRTQCAADGTNPRDLVCDKIREFCVLAERSGHQWGWADMCCIDKTSSTELSEAITSMYRYYSLAEVCYAYLRDVPTASPDDLRAPESAFRKSRWHKRGWTLQELIAPPLMVFVSDTWELLGAKWDLAGVLEEITRVPVAVLKLEVSPSAHCVAARMSWAADRKTTRPEDEAYCLMGIFGIFMPPLYGEGTNAFLRLQEEIIRRTDDPSIFAWGPIKTFDGYPVEVGSPPSRAFQPLLDLTIKNPVPLFANSPFSFRDGHCIKWRAECPRSEKSLLQFWRRPTNLSKRPTFSITPYGVMAHVLVFKLSGANTGVLVAPLLGVELRDRTLGLLLRRVESHDHTRPLYIPCSFTWLSSQRIVVLDEDLQRMAVDMKTTLKWKTIYILIGRGNPLLAMDPRGRGLQKVYASLHMPFYIPRSEITRLIDWRWPLSTVSLHPSNPTDLSWRQYVAIKIDVWLSAANESPTVTVVIYLGLCQKASPDHPQHWARIAEYEHTGVDELEGKAEYDCAEHHVDERPRQTHPLTIYNDANRPSMHHTSLELSFAPYPVSLAHCRRLNIRLRDSDAGSVALTVARGH